MLDPGAGQLCADLAEEPGELAEDQGAVPAGHDKGQLFEQSVDLGEHFRLGRLCRRGSADAEQEAD